MRIRRPLSDKQLKYALGDVTHLREAFLLMRDELDESNRMNWVASDMQKLEDPDVYDNDPDKAWKRLKLRRPKPDYAAVLVAVAAWRERRAQETNRPRRRILKDDAIHEIAIQKPRNDKEFDRLRAMPNGFIRSRHAEGLAETVADAVENPDKYAPDIPRRKQNAQTPPGAPELLKVLLKHVSEEHDVMPRLIANAAEIERIARGETTDDIAALQGWRKEIFGDKALALLNGNLAMSFENGQVRLFAV